MKLRRKLIVFVLLKIIDFELLYENHKAHCFSHGKFFVAKILLKT